MQKMIFNAGEKRHVKMLVHSTNDEPFYIRTASYELSRSGVVEDSGVCIVEEHCVDCLIEPKLKNTSYELRLTYEIADEIYVEVISISVT